LPPLVSLIAGVLLLASFPFWIPRLVIGLRMNIFTRINGEEGIAIPGKIADASHFRQIYSHPAAEGRSRGAALSDLFWYWLSPGPEIHQEHLEPGAKYEEVARTTRRMDGSIHLRTRGTSQFGDGLLGARVHDRKSFALSAYGLAANEQATRIWDG